MKLADALEEQGQICSYGETFSGTTFCVVHGHVGRVCPVSRNVTRAELVATLRNLTNDR